MTIQGVDLGWVAGLLEGEGYFCSSNKLSITCSMTDREPIEKLKELCGGSIYDLRTRTVTGKLVYRWHLSRHSSMALVKLLYDLMSPRRQRKIDEMWVQHSKQRSNVLGSKPHGTWNRYNKWGCRCAPCKKAHSEYRRNLKLGTRLGLS